MKKQNNQQNPKSTKEQQLFMKIKNENIRSNGKQTTPKAEEGYCNEATQSSPLTHSKSHQAQNTVEHIGVKQRRAWTKQEIREVILCYMCCRQHFTENYKKMYEIWRQRNPECKMYMDATKKLMNHKNCIMKHKKITDKIRRDKERTARKSGKSHRRKREEEKQEHLGITKDDEQKPNAAFTMEEVVKIHQQREQIYKLKEKSERMYYQVTQIAIDKRPRLQKLQNMFKIKVTVKMANKAMEEILEKKT